MIAKESVFPVCDKPYDCLSHEQKKSAEREVLRNCAFQKLVAKKIVNFNCV